MGWECGENTYLPEGNSLIDFPGLWHFRCVLTRTHTAIQEFPHLTQATWCSNPKGWVSTPGLGVTWARKSLRKARIRIWGQVTQVGCSRQVSSVTETDRQPEDRAPLPPSCSTGPNATAGAMGADVTEVKWNKLLWAHCNELENTVRFHEAACIPELHITSHYEHGIIQVEYQVMSVHFEHISGILIL